MTHSLASADAPLRVAYLVNHYPKVSHTFIRREILALERQGVRVERFSIRGAGDTPVDPEDRTEHQKTRYVLERGLASLLAPTLAAFLKSPLRFLGALRLALSLSRRSDRSALHHLAYFAEACRLSAWLRGSAVTHLHAHFGTNPAEVALLVHALGGPPFSFTVHGPEEFDKPEFLALKRKIELSRFVVAISSYGKSQLFRWIDHPFWHKVKIVHCGLEPAFYEGSQSPPPAARRLVCIGRLCEQKGQHVLLEAWAKLAARQPDCELVLVGDGEMRGVLEERIAALGIGAQVRITGWVSSDVVRDELLAARALVLPSFAEGLPVAIMEAMSLSRPVISTYVAGIPELVLPQENGWLVPAGDVEALADALEECLAASPEELSRRAEAGRARVLERHDVDVESARLRALFSGTMPGAS